MDMMEFDSWEPTPRWRWIRRLRGKVWMRRSYYCGYTPEYDGYHYATELEMTMMLLERCK